MDIGENIEPGHSTRKTERYEHDMDLKLLNHVEGTGWKRI
jgi:hypothetical protein